MGSLPIPPARPSHGASRRVRVLLAAAVVLLVAFGYLCFELGRYWAGYSLLDHRSVVEENEELRAAHAAAAADLERELAILRTSREIDRETYAQVEATLTRLETTIQAQEEELAFYRGIVSPQDGHAGLRIQSLEVLPGDRERRYMLRLVLVQAIVHSRRVSGVVKLRVEGILDGAAASFGLEELGDEQPGPAELAYEFRYFEPLERELVLPVGFAPTNVVVEVSPREPRGDRLTQTFEWAVRG